jgi:Cytochrome c554 and c-prime
MSLDRPATLDCGHRTRKGIVLLAIIGVSVIIIAEEFRRSSVPRAPDQASSERVLASSTIAGAERITGYVGAAACSECHPGEAALYARSGHRRTLWPATADQNPVVAWLDGKTWTDPEVPEISWSYQVKDGQLTAWRAVDGRSETFPLDFGFGSGTRGVTFVALRAGADPGISPGGIEHRLSYFADGPSLGITPGQEKLKGGRLDPRDVHSGKPMGPELTQQCFNCHSTLTSTLPGNRLETTTLIPNVSCERCHGPGRAHVEAARSGHDGLTMPMGYDRAQPWAEVNLCGECHRLPRFVSSSSINPDNTGIVRFQGVGVAMSACYAKGLGSLRCTTCHDPHDRASRDHSHYEAACLSCHRSAQAQKACPISPAANCVGCHMPRREVRGNGVFTDHWIRKS